jgi:inner membrane protein
MKAFFSGQPVHTGGPPAGFTPESAPAQVVHGSPEEHSRLLHGPVPTIVTHPAVPLAIGLGLGPRAVPSRLLAAGAFASILPDADVVGFRLGIPYAAELGHRGLSHSLVFAALAGLLGAFFHRRLRCRFLTAFLFLFAATASHGVLDAFTNGGLGVAFFWPFSSARHFASARVIQVAPIGVARLFSAHGAAVLLSELRWVWFPSALVGLALAWTRRFASWYGAARSFR